MTDGNIFDLATDVGLKLRLAGQEYERREMYSRVVQEPNPTTQMRIIGEYAALVPDDAETQADMVK